MNEPPNPPPNEPQYGRPAPPPYPGAPMSYAPAGTYVAPRTGLATAALVLGILGLVAGCAVFGGVFAVIAIIIGIVAMRRAGAQPQVYGGRGRALGGVITGVLGVLVSAAMGVGLIALMPAVRGGMRAAVDLEAVAQGLRAYTAEFDVMPPDLQTLVKVKPLPGLPTGSADPTQTVTYVAGVDSTDPPDWILAWTRMRFYGQEMFMILRPNLVVADQPMNAADFQRKLAEFKREFEELNARPPVIHYAPGEAETALSDADGNDPDSE